MKRSAMILSNNTRINIQKSLWRMKLNIDTPDIILNAANIVKLKKMYNYIRKIYVLNMYTAFLMIQRHSRNSNEIYRGDT